MEDNFEKIIKKKFENYTQPPPSDLWNKVAASVFEEAPRNYLIAVRNLAIAFLISLSASFSVLNWQANKSVLTKKANLEANQILKKTEQANSTSINDEENSNAHNATKTPDEQNERKPRGQQLKSITAEQQQTSIQTDKSNESNSLNESSDTDNKNYQRPEVNQYYKQSSSMLKSKMTISMRNKAQPINTSNKQAVDKNMNKLPLLSYEAPKSRREKVAMALPFELELRKHELIAIPRFFVGFYIGPSLSYRIFKSNHNLMGLHKNEYERAAATYDLGIEAGYKIDNNWELSIGLSIDNFTESYDFSGIKITHDTSYVFHTDHLTGQVVSTLEIEEQKQQVGHNTKNNYQFISLPLMIGYRLGVTERLLFIPAVGANIDLITRAEASWLHPETLEPMVMQLQNGQFNSVLFASSAQISMQYEYSKRWSLFFRPRFRMIHQSIFKESDLLNHRPYSFDFNFGVRRTLN